MKLLMRIDSLFEYAARNRAQRRQAVRNEARFPLQLLEQRIVPATIQFIDGTLTITAESAESVAVAVNESNVAVNGSATKIAAADVAALVLNGDSGANKLDLSGVHEADFTILSDVQIVGGTGNDVIVGSDFHDSITWNNGDGSDSIDGGDGQDKLVVNGSTSAGDAFSVTGSGGRLSFQRTNLGLFSLSTGSVEDLVVNSGGGNDTVTIGNTTSSGLDNVTLFGGDGDDTADMTGINLDALRLLTVDGEDGNDLVIVSAGNDGANGTPDAFKFGLVNTFDGPEAELSVNGVTLFASADETARVQINGSSDADSLAIQSDPMLGLPIPVNGLLFNGSGGSDSLVISGAVETSAYDFSSATNGSAQLDLHVVDFTGLELVDDQSTATSRTVFYSAINDTVTVSNFDNATDNIIQVASPSGPTTRLTQVDNGTLSVNVGGGDDTLTVASLDDTFDGTLLLDGDSGNDTITISSLANLTGSIDLSADGGAGDDILNSSIAAQDLVLFGGDGSDTLLVTGSLETTAYDFSGATEGSAQLDLHTSNFSSVESITDESIATSRTVFYGAAHDTVAVSDFGTTTDSIVQVASPSGPATRISHATGSTLTVNVGAGNDTVSVATLDNIFSGSLLIDGDTGIDSITIGSLTNVLGTIDLSADGGAGDDTLNASAFGRGVALYGSAGNDVLIGGSGADQLFGDAGSDVLTGNGGNDSLDGGANIDTVSEGGNVNVVLTNTSLTGFGTDSLFSIESAQINGGSSANVFDASASTVISVIFNSGPGADTLFGSAGRDILNGGTGNDVIYGLGGQDVLFGAAGDDFLDGGASNDTLIGADGLDVARRKNNTDFRVDNTGMSELIGQNVVAFDSFNSIETVSITGGTSANRIDIRAFANTGLATIQGGDGDDTLLGSTGRDLLQGEGGNDVISGGPSFDSINGGLGNDVIYEIANANFTVNGLRVTVGTTAIDQVVSIEGIVLVAGPGSNRLDASASSVPVTLLGGAGNDTLIGSAFADVLIGGNRASSTAGVDSLNGLAGNDILDNDPNDVRTTEVGDQVLANVFSLIPTWIDAL